MERETGIEPATNGLGSRDSTTELLPLSKPIIEETSAQKSSFLPKRPADAEFSTILFRIPNIRFTNIASLESRQHLFSVTYLQFVPNPEHKCNFIAGAFKRRYT